MTTDPLAERRCRHGHLFPGCPHDDCPSQAEYLREMDAALTEFLRRQEEECRKLVRSYLGLPAEWPVIVTEENT